MPIHHPLHAARLPLSTSTTTNDFYHLDTRTAQISLQPAARRARQEWQTAIIDTSIGVDIIAGNVG
ncbi:hypothetical protein BHYA_0154g00160 [Botrytis hyacinthi]|uniref:Uncharacterized protein n=1 Tax=Botrytis hyacinthi TaxID=278943 RepID=A0A4Z1GEX1_9HELO|nr:hypothetical protein BHYA_0154g00160 [Botrytis hyacinthi]